MSYKEIAKELNTSVKVIFNRMKEYNIKPRVAAKRCKDKYHRGKYIYIIDKNHFRADDRGRVPEHILIIEAHIGRKLRIFGFNDKDNEVVHHINEDSKDNRLENLQLLTASEHIKLHWKLKK